MLEDDIDISENAIANLINKRDGNVKVFDPFIHYINYSVVNKSIRVWDLSLSCPCI